jgi:Fur family transcriptional regulator, ferric uptake regulator
MGLDWAAHARRQLALSGHRAGGAREEVVALLGAEPCLMSAQEIHDKLLGRGRRVGLASVYRALEVLTDLRLVHRVDVAGTASYETADPSGEHHHHAICDDCGQRAPFEDPELERLIHRLGERVGYDVAAHDVVLRGRCPDCTR